MRARAILGLALGLSSAVSSVHAAPPEGPSEPGAPPPRYDEPPTDVEPAPPSELELPPPVELERAPATGVGRIVGGSLLLAGGGALLGGAVGLWITLHSDHENECDSTVDEGGDCRAGAFDGFISTAIGIPLLLAGVGALVTGGVLLGKGIAAHRPYRGRERKNHNHIRWNARLAPSLSPLPGARPGIGGLSFGVAGRF